MTSIRKMGFHLGLALLMLFLSASLALAQSYGLTRTTKTGGGTLQTSGGTYTLKGSIAQAEAGPVVGTTSGNYALNGGIWAGYTPSSASPSQEVYLPIILHNP